jgi:hypothetical protein
MRYNDEQLLSLNGFDLLEYKGLIDDNLSR